MKFKHILGFIALGLIVILVTSQTAKKIVHRGLDQDLCLRVNDGGTPGDGVCVDGPTKNLGVGTDTPSTKTHIKESGSNFANGTVRVEGADFPGITLYDSSGDSKNWRVMAHRVSNNTLSFHASSSAGGSPEGGTHVLQLGDTGTITVPGQLNVTSAGATGGNVVFGCTRRSQSTAGSDSTLTCSAGERVMGGGCDYSGGSSTTTHMRISFPQADNQWRCIYNGTLPSDTITYGICCKY